MLEIYHKRCAGNEATKSLSYHYRSVYAGEWPHYYRFSAGRILFWHNSHNRRMRISGRGILRHRQYRDGPESDERSKKIGAYGLSYAWLTGIIFISVLYWLDIMGILLLGTQVVLALSLMVLVISAVIYQIYLFQRGDVE